MPIIPPIPDKITASKEIEEEWLEDKLWLYVIHFPKRSETVTNIIFIMPITATTKEMAAIPVSNG